MVNSNRGVDEALDRPLVLGIVLVLLLIVGSAIVSAYNVHRLREDSALVDHTHQVVAALEAIMETVCDAESAQRAFIITGDKTHLDPYRSAPAIAEDYVERIEGLTADNTKQQIRTPELRKRITARLETLFANAKLREEQGFELAQQAIATNRGKLQMEALRSTINEMQNVERSLLIKRSATATQMYYTTLATVRIGHAARAAFDSRLRLDDAAAVADARGSVGPVVGRARTIADHARQHRRRRDRH